MTLQKKQEKCCKTFTPSYIIDNWEAFLRLGGVDNDWHLGERNFSIGFGSKATLYKAGDLKLGGLFQLSWSWSDETEEYASPGGIRSHDHLETDIIEMQIVVGPTYQLTQKVLVYGGPFFHFIDGNWESHYRSSSWFDKESGDIDGRSIFGGYVGTQIGIAENASFNIEYQHTASAHAIGTSLIWRLP